FVRREAENRHLERAGEQLIVQFAGTGVGELQLDARMLGTQAREQIDQLVRSDRAHDAELERRFVELAEILGDTLCFRGLGENLREIGTNCSPKLREMGICPLAME